MADFLTTVTVLDKAFYSDMVTSLDQGLLGITFLFDPDFFWNPTTGLFGSGSFASVTATVVANGSNQEQQPQDNDFDIVTRMKLMGGGAILLTTLLYHLYFLHDERDERAFLRYKLTAYMAQVVLFANYAWWWKENADDEDNNKDTNAYDTVADAPFKLHRNFFAAAAVMKTFLALWLLVGLYRISHSQRGSFVVDSDLEQANRYSRAAVVVAMLYTVPFAVLLSFNPNVFSPAGSLPYYHSQPETGSTFNALQTAASRFEGIHLLSFAILLYDLPAVPLQIAELAFTGMLLYAAVFQAGLWMEPTSTAGTAAVTHIAADSVAFRWQMMVHILLLLVVGGLLGKAKRCLNHRRHKITHANKEGMIPDLHPESDEDKVKKE